MPKKNKFVKYTSKSTVMTHVKYASPIAKLTLKLQC